MYQKNLLRQGCFSEARKFGVEEGLHDTAVYRLLTDIEVPQSTINGLLDSDKRMHINPTVKRGTYIFQEAPRIKRKLIFDPQTVDQLYWHDRVFDLLKMEGPKAAAKLAKEKHLAHDIINHFNHHQIYRKAVKHLDAAMARMVNDRECLVYDRQRDIKSALDTHLKNYRGLERKHV